MPSKNKYWHREWSRDGSFLVHSSGLRLQVTRGDGYTDIETDDASLAICRAKESARGMASHDFDERLQRLLKEGVLWHQKNP